ncbi:MAG: MFS transporter [Deltaproteobacteria bacterium]|jgi:MFS family permease|nr:MFS transporter [Deltaproteobacteria bacterium]
MKQDPARDYYFSEDKDGQKLWTKGFRAFIFLNVFIFLGFDVLLPTLTVYLEGHGHSRDAIGRIFSLFTVAAIIMRMLAPRLVLAIRPFVLVRLGLLLAGLAALSYFFAHSAPAASLARFLHGLGFGLTSTVLTAMAAQTVPGNKMAQGMGFLGLGTILTLAVGPSLGIWLRDGFGYLVLFLTVSGFYVGGLLWTLRMPDLALPGPPPDKPRPKLVFLSRQAFAPSAMMFMTGISISAVAIYLALFFKETGLGYSGHFFGFATIGILVSRVFAGQIQDRFGHRMVISPAIASMTAAIILIPSIRDTGLLFLAAVLWGLSTGTIFPSVQALAFNSVKPHQRTSVASSLFNAFDLGIGFGSILLGLLSEHFETYRAAFRGAMANCLVFLGFYLIYYFVLHPPSARTRPRAALPQGKILPKPGPGPARGQTP